MKRVSQAGRPEAGPGRPVSIRDVADAAGVSPATVSRVLNGTAPVSPAVRARVEQAIRQMDFYPYDLAAGRARRKMGMVGLIVPDITNPFWAEVALGAEDALRPHGYALILVNTGDVPAQEEDAIALLRRKRVDGVLVAAMREAGPSLRRLRDAGVPVVLLGRGADDGTFDLVTADGVQGAYLATAHLLDLGHRRIGFLGGPPDERTTQERRTGYQRALAERAIIPPDAWIAENPGWDYSAGAERTRTLLARQQHLTALVAANDVIALGALQALDEAGLRVPDDISLTGFDDLELARICRPALTTVAQPRAERGRLAATLLLERLGRVRSTVEAPSDGDAPRRIILTPRLVVRQSTQQWLEGDAPVEPVSHPLRVD